MKRNLFLWGKWRTGIYLFGGLLFVFASCAQGFDNDYQLSLGVSGITLESPKAEGMQITPSADGTTVTIRWPFVSGAGGYLFTFYNVDDPNNPVAVGEENEVFDRCSATRPLTEETRYEIVVKTLGNEQLNNKEAVEATKVEYSTWIDAIVIPDNTDLYTYFTENTHESGAVYELVPDGKYSISDDIDFGIKSITIRGDKLFRPEITAVGKLKTGGAGIKLRYLKLNLTGKTNEFIQYDNISAEMPKEGSDNYAVMEPVFFESCLFSGVTYRIISSSNSTKYFLSSLTIKDCVFNMSLSSAFLEVSGTAWVKNFTVSNSTFNNKKGASTGQRMMQYGNGSIAKSAGSAKLTFTNSTFYNISYAQKIANYNMMRQTSYIIELKRNIFVDCGNQRLVKDLRGDNDSAVLISGENSYWYDGSFPTTEVTDSRGDHSGTHFEVDPTFADVENGDFTLGASSLKSAGIGDPRWLD